MKCNLTEVRHKARIYDNAVCEGSHHDNMTEESPDDLYKNNQSHSLQDVKPSLRKRHRKLKIRHQTPGMQKRISKADSTDDIWNYYEREGNSETDEQSSSSSDGTTLNLCCSQLPNEKKPKRTYLKVKNSFKTIETRTWNKYKETKGGKIVNMATKVEVINSKNSLDRRAADCQNENDLDSTLQNSVDRYDPNLDSLSSDSLKNHLIEHYYEDSNFQYPTSEETDMLKEIFELKNNELLNLDYTNQHQPAEVLSASVHISDETPDEKVLNENFSVESLLPNTLDSETKPLASESDEQANENVSEFSKISTNKRHGEAYHHMNNLRMQLNVIDEKFSKLENILVCENCSINSRQLSVEKFSKNNEMKCLKNTENKTSAIDEQSGSTVEVTKNVIVPKFADASTFTTPLSGRGDLSEQNYHSGDPRCAREMHQCIEQTIPIAIHGFENSYVTGDTSIQSRRKEKKKGLAYRRGRILNWMRKKYLAMGKMIKCIP